MINLCVRKESLLKFFDLKKGGKSEFIGFLNKNLPSTMKIIHNEWGFKIVQKVDERYVYCTVTDDTEGVYILHPTNIVKYDAVFFKEVFQEVPIASFPEPEVKINRTPIAWSVWGGGKSSTYFGMEADDFIFNHKRSNTFAILRVYQTLEEAKKDPSW